MATDTITPQERMRRKLFAISGAFNLSRGDRLDFATTFLDRHVESFSDLDRNELARLCDAMEGAALICRIQIEKRTGQRR